MAFDAYIFDLDGTILDTLPDLVRLTNMVLDERSWPVRSRDEILSFVGNGGRALLKRSAPPGTPEHDIDDAFVRWRELYPAYGHAMTKPYAGIPEALSSLKEQGARLGVLSNKFDSAVGHVVAEHFPGIFDLARGECDDIPRKPDPAGLLSMLEQLGVCSQRTAYVGDSPTDVLVAQRVGAYSVAVTWGYQPFDSLVAAAPDAVVDAPSQLLEL